MKKNLEIEHASELNSIQSEHTAQIESLKLLLTKEKQTSQDALNEKCETQNRNDQLSDMLASVKSNLESERVTYEEELTQKQLEKNALEKSMAEIRAVQEKTKSMVSRTQADWFTKNEELQESREDYENLERAVRSLLERFIDPHTKDMDYDLKKATLKFKDSVEELTKEYNDLKLVSDIVPRNKIEFKRVTIEV